MNKRYSILIIILIWVFIISFMIMYHNYKLENDSGESNKDGTSYAVAIEFVL